MCCLSHAFIQWRLFCLFIIFFTRFTMNRRIGRLDVRCLICWLLCHAPSHVSAAKIFHTLFCISEPWADQKCCLSFLLTFFPTYLTDQASTHRHTFQSADSAVSVSVQQGQTLWTSLLFAQFSLSVTSACRWPHTWEIAERVSLAFPSFFSFFSFFFFLLFSPFFSFFPFFSHNAVSGKESVNIVQSVWHYISLMFQTYTSISSKFMV